MEPLVSKDLFDGLKACTWLYTGAEGPSLRSHAHAIQEYLRSRSRGPAGRERNSQIERSCKETLAKLINTNPDNIALLSNASEALSLVAQSIHLEPQDNVVIHNLEFPSGVLPWLTLKKSGIEVRVVSHKDWQIPIDTLMSHVDEHTRMIVTSHVSFISGTRIDYKTLYNRLKCTKALLLLDATQSLGVVPVDLDYTDFLVASSYKWLLAPHGVGVFAVNLARLDDLQTRFAGWRSVEDAFAHSRFESFTPYADARRFELGFPSYPTIYALNESVKFLLSVGAERIEQHILALGEALMQRFSDLDYEVMTPERSEERAGNVSVVCPEGGYLAAVLQQQGIYTWGGDGRLRASVHLFNDGRDIEALSTALEKVRG